MERSAPDGPALQTAASDIATMLFTSGTTTAPKGCLMPHSGFVSLIPFVICFGIDRGDLLSPRATPAGRTA
jgi:acetyl-CoA synthetase